MFKFRSNKFELLDEEGIPEHHLFRNLYELHIINKYLGGYKISLDGLEKITSTEKEYHLMDIGSGGGDTLFEIKKWSKKNNRKLKLIGIDLKQTCIDYANKKNQNNDVQFICDDYLNALKHTENIDIIHASLFCHHLIEDKIIELIQFAKSANATLLINDLERNPIAYYAILFLTKIFSKSYLVKNDAPLSVLRGFKLNEWKSLLESSNSSNYTIKSKWAFRHQVIIYAN